MDELKGKQIERIETREWTNSTRGFEQAEIFFTDGSSLIIRGFFRLEVQFPVEFYNDF